MAYPTCAPARHPTTPSASESASDSTQTDLAALSRQATAEVDAVREAHIALACVNKMLIHAPGLAGDEGLVSRSELKALASLIKAEVERRFQAVHSTIASMPRGTGLRRKPLSGSP